MVERSIHLVGSIPCENAEDGMRLALSKNGHYLRTLSDGEAGGEWIIPIIRSLRENPSISVQAEGDWSSYKNVLVLRVRRGAKLKADSLDFGRVALFEESYPLFQKLREEYQQPDLAYQVSIAGDLDVALLSMGMQGALRHRSVFAEETIREIRAIQTKAHGDVVFQLELPIELVLVTKMPGFLQSAVSRFLARKVLRLVKEAPAGTRFGVHLCLGDLHNQALGRMRTTAPW
ncbi:hypothetical protein [Ktedonospora formicarum]|uniref:Uncharacterized protein n=1 Tax=Ktedonospora formicarum TaxID=2778364 RepID=A0A8J3IBK3_9CHLR|nr:hypothetical protein [Ktedonospora formicarum]GHO50933.1 hypothetical protein KSX_90960 [Ktedonospora formicarum]